MGKCEYCNGTGKIKCPVCRGTKVVLGPIPCRIYVFPPIFNEAHLCRTCKGEGEIKCTMCDGTGKIED